ncbi:OsmC family protein [Salmonella enterica subsp. enterica serovar Denver]
MTIHKKGQAHWEGDIKRGKGTVSTESGVLNQQPYGFNTRFEGAQGTTADVSLDKVEAGFAITKIALQSKVAVADIDASTFDQIIQKAKAGCPVSQVLNAEITLDYQLNA